ncbi:retrotransposon protein, putative, ty1-copia subclass [Tanacetum coccineum]|uniref:Retrotransposon protein, putative, ty1-copia subclass n=1 Tax=Tanacetum coccineum TaxID=301880 RepID=A0ABQ5EDM0_9ASTR
MTTSSTNNSVFRGFLEKQKLSGPNFIDWYRQLRIVLSVMDKLDYLEQPIPPAPVPAQAGQQVAPEALAAHAAWVKGSKEIAEIMFMTMEPEIQLYLENFCAYKMLQKLKTLFAHQADQELLQTVQNYNMHGMGKTVNEFHAMRKLHEQTQPKQTAPALHVIRAGKVQKKKNKQKPHFRARAELLKDLKLSQGASSLGIFTIELNTFLNRSWIYDTGCCTHICNTTQVLRSSRKLKPGALSLYVGNGQREAVEAISVFYLSLLSGLEIVLNNCHYAPSITRGVIYVSRLYEDGFINRFVNNTIQVSRNNMVYFSVILRDGIFEINLSNSYANESSKYTVSNKRDKLDLDSALLWHFRLGRISKKRIEKLQHDGLLNSTDLKAFEKCVPCMSEKMARKPYTHQLERAKDLLGLIHTDDHGIIAHRTPPYTPQHNGVSEKRNRTLLDIVRFMMSQTTLPKSCWDYAIETASRILNMVPTKKVEKTPYENKVLVDRNAEFLENSLINQESSGSLEDLEIIQEEDTHPSIDTSLNHEEDDLEIDEPQSDIIPIRGSTRTRRPTDCMCLYIDAEEHELGDLGEPANNKAALLDPESDKYLNAMNWLFKKKTDMDGTVHTYKARLLAKGYTQTLGIDYEETFSSVADIRAIRILIAIAAFYDYEIWQMDVKTAFLNGYLSEEVYMEQPKGFVNPKYPNRVCKLKRSIYGLKQASRQWNKRFDDEIKKFGFTQNRDEPCVYINVSGSNVTFLILDFDDILIMGSNIPMLQDVKSYLGRCFAMKDLGEVAYILGIKIYRDRS